jgi:hypothetical protein
MKGMQLYVNQLLEDIGAAMPPQPDEPISHRPQTMEEHFEEIERWIEGEPENTFSFHCGLKSDQFPPEDRLTLKQIKEISRAFNFLLLRWNLGTDIPNRIPPRIAYPFLIGVLDQKVPIVKDGMITIEFCDYERISCPFKMWCKCQAYTGPPKSFDVGADEELPF